MSDESLAFRVGVLAVDGGCVAASQSECEGSLQAHHVITQAQLRRAHLDEYRWSARNGASVCERHHRRHHARYEPIRLRLLPERNRLFAAEHGLSYLLDRYYA